jgi:CubicO group peptidase (beta-lactamase class C family)
VTKSFTGTLAGIAIEQGLFALDDTIPQYVDRFESFANMDDRKRSIRIANVLNMQSGLDCDDNDFSTPGNEGRMYMQDDWVKFLLSVPMIYAPGTVSRYCSGAVTVLGTIIASRSGKKLEDFAEVNLQRPLNMSPVRWLHSPLGVTNASSTIQPRPRDAAKLGSLMLNGGRWNGAQVVPQAWMERAAQKVTIVYGESYGWMWWKADFAVRGTMQPVVFASGNGGNFIFVVPAERLVVVITSSNYNRASPSRAFFRDSILPTVQ